MLCGAGQQRFQEPYSQSALHFFRIFPHIINPLHDLQNFVCVDKEIFTVGSESYLFADSVKKRIAQFLFKLLYLHCYG